ncbi:leucine-rich repeat-containing protein kinase family protein [Pseudomonas sp. DTU_2021_1001937_2_SI_NGA_ILE_001]|uniref:leucine-rich repeat-containing protein kinase family protein n=1 Tax=Pseudomonas sp. DTU_2021_1001937_2_SI_NGA_ILE_001 TaxID=3077589 RepID=UPI0028FC16DE|nr:leucine-rich repeat-containing protein kinase family protein [Pseudomonas sp. DTU_2021_1001937_2_SI_NGA_ILE_001]WNW10505.1 leucine-rich repeat-containing protein kinase family protein [Pseudomonas sp. DTU_2021_1001937_2_SI_NGA_ILE_001]
MHTLADLRAGRLAGIERLDLSCGLEQFPPEIFELADTLRVLNLSGNALDQLPDDLYRLDRLEVLFASENRFTELPSALGRCKRLSMIGFKANRIEHIPAQALPAHLRWLILTDNHLESLPEQLGHCSDLQKLMLAGNRLRSLPASLANCDRLELLRIASNRLDTLPDWLLSMPALAWLAHAGNPFSTCPAPARIRRIPWRQLTVSQQLGEGASGIIQQGQWQSEEGSRPVAIKLYKGELTSDGSPLDEMQACMAAATHPQLIDVLGEITDHPEQRRGLVMGLIDPEWSNLAGPPSLDSCTRDCYPADLTLDLPALMRLATGIAAVTAHLHARSLTHGDLYAHNILWQPDGRCLLGDFGAAAFHPAAAQAQALERIEVRAFGIFLQELLDRCPAASDESRLQTLAQACRQDQVLARPAMHEVHRLLLQLSEA